jgi:hypothetical protein
VAVTEVQDAIRLAWVFAIGQLGGDIPNAVVFDMFHEEPVPNKNAIDVEEK